MKRIIPTAETALRAFSKLACIVGGWCLILLSFAICVEVVLRKVFSSSLQGIDEYGGYALAITASLGMAYCFYEHSHIQIDVVVRRVPRLLARALGILAIAILGLVVFMLALEAQRLTEESLLFGAFANTPLRTPIVYPQAIWTAGFWLFLAVIVLRLLYIAQSLLTRDDETVGDLLGEARSEAEADPVKLRGLE